MATSGESGPEHEETSVDPELLARRAVERALGGLTMAKRLLEAIRAHYQHASDGLSPYRDQSGTLTPDAYGAYRLSADKYLEADEHLYPLRELIGDIERYGAAPFEVPAELVEPLATLESTWSAADQGDQQQ